MLANYNYIFIFKQLWIQIQLYWAKVPSQRLKGQNLYNKFLYIEQFMLEKLLN